MKHFFHRGVFTFLMMVLFLGSIFSTSVLAADNEVKLALDQNKASVTVFLGQNSQDITSLQLSFQVRVLEGDTDQVDIGFDFDSSITSSVKTFQYDQDTGVLNLYVSGRNTLFSENQVNLGKITLESKNATPVQVMVEPKEDSLVTVNALNELKKVTSVSVNSVNLQDGSEENGTSKPETSSPEGSGSQEDSSVSEEESILSTENPEGSLPEGSYPLQNEEQVSPDSENVDTSDSFFWIIISSILILSSGAGLLVVVKRKKDN